ncbi:enoyl-CoA hydratase/isomerase family protein [Nocardioides sp. zg-DK7169]|uniref:enoyl-CoA hydratase/isomerase family protein n=1 Tax=Nocardioides sp. zg-DK7169 TaxID=2736600 RepID=UPI001553A7C9|nr:enoyl-CoA hydratase-related protein [Nocardioides sp. zg-DK7169]NPC97337.1 enoyl-CoA hydratase/isomerase family protein [Nocardioides sp. zg-DK7169]
MSDVLVEEAEPGHVVVTLNRPQTLNAMALSMVAELHDVLSELNASPAVRTVVLTGAGRGFCSGAEIKSADDARRDQPRPDQNKVAHLLGQQEAIVKVHELVHRMRVPVIAAVNGVAVGGGFSLSLACDIRVAARSARFGAVFIRHGISNADMGTSYFLPRLVGASRAAELMLTGRVFDAEEARDLGLVVDVVDDGTVVDRALATARQVAENSALGVWMTKETMWQTIDAPSLRHALDMENRTQIMCVGSGELERAFAGFKDGGRPEWSRL